MSVRAKMHVPCPAGYRGGVGLIATVIHILGNVTLKVTFQVRPVIEIENGACIKALKNIEFTFPESSREPSMDIPYSKLSVLEKTFGKQSCWILFGEAKSVFAISSMFHKGAGLKFIL